MHSLVYVSQATQHFDELSTRELANQAYQRNEQLLITGFLSYYDGQFLQYLEGEKEKLSNLMDTICADTRHTILRTVQLPPTSDRRFATWHMRYLPPHRVVTINLEKVLGDLLTRMNSSLYREEWLIRSVQSIIEKFSTFFAAFPHTPPPTSLQLIRADSAAAQFYTGQLPENNTLFF
ncbi:MAG: BLUF domain-containing protein [Bacteroidota bacterium]